MDDGFFQIQEFDRIDSTNAQAKRLPPSSVREGTVIRARSQSGGYGRQGKVWESPQGGLYATLILKPQGGSLALPTLSLLAGLSVCCTLRSLGVQGVCVKWPNDVLAKRRGASFGKLAGILIEKQGDTVYLGIGMNVFSPKPRCADAAASCNDAGLDGVDAASDREGIASFSADADSGCEQAASKRTDAGLQASERFFASKGAFRGDPSRFPACPPEGYDPAFLSDRDSWFSGKQDGKGAAGKAEGNGVSGIAAIAEASEKEACLSFLLRRILEDFHPRYFRWQEEGFAPFVQEFAHCDCLKGREVLLFDAYGQTLAEGKAAGVEESGCLRIAGSSGVHRFFSGSVRFAAGKDAVQTGGASS